MMESDRTDNVHYDITVGLETNHADRLPRLRGYPDFVRLGRSIAALQVPIKVRAYRLLSLCAEMGLPNLHMSRNDLSPVHHRVVSSFRGDLREDEECVRLLIRLNDYIEGLGGKPVINLPWCKVGKGMSYYGMSLRRSIETLTQSKSWRFDKREPALPQLQKDAVAAHNRFAVLAHNLYGEDANDDVWADREDFTIGPFCTKEDRRYLTQAETNVTRKKMGYKPKGDASVESPRYKEIKTSASLDVHAQRVPLFMRKAADVVRSFRADKPSEWDDGDCTTLVRQFFAVERWNTEWIALGGESYLLGVLDPG